MRNLKHLKIRERSLPSISKCGKYVEMVEMRLAQRNVACVARGCSSISKLQDAKSRPGVAKRTTFVYFEMPDTVWRFILLKGEHLKRPLKQRPWRRRAVDARLAYIVPGPRRQTGSVFGAPPPNGISVPWLARSVFPGWPSPASSYSFTDGTRHALRCPRECQTGSGAREPTRANVRMLKSLERREI